MVKMKKNYGFTLIELLVVLVLMSMVLITGIALFNFPNKAFNIIVGQTNLEGDVNKVLRTIVADIRSAKKPDYETKAIIIYKDKDGNREDKSGRRVDIYDYKDSTYYKISYRYDNGILYRGEAQNTSVDNIKTANLSYSQVLEGVMYPSKGELFQDITNETTGEYIVDRRTISINLIAKDKTGKLLTSHERPVISTSRTKSSP